MTVTLIPQQLAEETDVGNESENVQAEQTNAQVQKLAELLAQAYVATPLFP